MSDPKKSEFQKKNVLIDFLIFPIVIFWRKNQFVFFCNFFCLIIHFLKYLILLRKSNCAFYISFLTKLYISFLISFDFATWNSKWYWWEPMVSSKYSQIQLLSNKTSPTEKHYLSNYSLFYSKANGSYFVFGRFFSILFLSGYNFQQPLVVQTSILCLQTLNFTWEFIFLGHRSITASPKLTAKNLTVFLSQKRNIKENHLFRHPRLFSMIAASFQCLQIKR